MLHKAAQISSEQLLTNQVEYPPYINQDKVIQACKNYGISVTCHVPLARGAVLKDPEIIKIAKFHQKSPAQVTLKWLIQQGNIIAVPRALSVDHIKENISLADFSLSDEQMETMSKLRSKNLRIVDPEVRRPVWDLP